MRSNFPVCEFTGNEIMIKCSFVACILLSELFILLSTVTDYWFTIEATSKYHAGIWRNCYLISLGTNKVCYSVDPTKGMVFCVRA